MPAPFISRQDLTDYLGRDVTADAGALQAVDAACDVVRNYAGQDFNLVVGGSVTLDGTGTDALFLPRRPVRSAGTVTVAGSAITDYVADTALGVLYRGTVDPSSSEWWAVDDETRQVWPWGRQNITVIYDHGYTDDDLPRSVRMVALSVASRILVQGVARNESLGDVTIGYWNPPLDLTAGEKQVLYSYKHAPR